MDYYSHKYHKKIIRTKELLNKENIVHKKEFNQINKITKINEILFMFLIMNKNMFIDIRDKKFFLFSKYRYVSPTFRAY